MAKQISEEESNLRRQSRRRLIGAIALVLLVVILLPVVFDSEPGSSNGNNIDLRIPDKDNSPPFQPKINLPELDKMASEMAAASAASSTVKHKPKPKAKSKPKPKPETIPDVKRTPATIQPLSVPKSGWSVQVGAFANADTARSLQAKLRREGFRSYTEKAGNVTRVRVGSFPTREAAENVKSKLEMQGMETNVINLDQGL